MFVQKNINFKGVMAFSFGHILWLTLWNGAVVFLYDITKISYLSIPWLPLSVIGLAVAFYVGFKNNQSYDRLWEARKLWGSIVNSSRAFGTSLRMYTTNTFTKEPVPQDEIDSTIKRILYRHIAYIYALRSQLLVSTPWEHINQGFHIRRSIKARRKKFGVGLVDSGYSEKYLQKFIPKDEYERLINYENTATQILDTNSKELRTLREKDLIDDFRHMELQNIINEMYNHQGGCERIKSFPLPRQYGSMSLVFVGIFIFLLPFGMVAEFEQYGNLGIWLAIPFCVLVAWVFLMMELIGDYSENPFEGLGNDIPMLAICRKIEIDLMEMMGEEDIPTPIEAKNGVLM